MYVRINFGIADVWTVMMQEVPWQIIVIIRQTRVWNLLTNKHQVYNMSTHCCLQEGAGGLTSSDSFISPATVLNFLVSSLSHDYHYRECARIQNFTQMVFLISFMHIYTYIYIIIHPTVRPCGLLRSQYRFSVHLFLGRPKDLFPRGK